MNFILAIQAPTIFSVPGCLQATVADWFPQSRPRFHPSRTEMTFIRNQIRQVKSPLGVTLECLSGQVWITLDGDPRDVVLDPGQMFTVDRDQRTLVMALDEATVLCTRSASA